MPRQVTVEIENTKVSNVLDVSYGVDTAPNYNGAPVDSNPRLAPITITRRSDDNTDWWRWALKPHAGGFKAGKISFKDPTQEDKDLIVVEWENGFVASYQEVVPDVQNSKSVPQTEMVCIHAQIIKVNGIPWEANWKGYL